MLTREEFIRGCLDDGDVLSAFEHCIDRAIGRADVPDRRGIDLDSSQRLRDCLDRAIEELKTCRDSF